MIATYNGQAVRILARAEARRHARWRSVPDPAWLFLIDALVLQALALENIKAGRIGLREYLPVVQSSDALTAFAAVLSILSLFVAGRARWAARNVQRGVVGEERVTPPSACAAATLTSLALRDWEASRMTSTGLEAFSAMPFENLCTSRRKLATGARSRRARPHGSHSSIRRF